MKKFIASFLLVIVLLLLLEGGARVVLSGIYNRSFDASLILDNKYLRASGLKENAVGYVWGKVFHTDRLGCRKGPKAYSSTKKKWLFIGDSVTEGVGVDDSSTFAALVAKQIDSVNVMNYSLIGYSDADYLNVLKTLLANRDSSISKVTIFFCLNDVYGKTNSAALPVMAKQNFIGQLNGLMQDNYFTYKLTKLLVYQMSDRYFQYDSRFYAAGDTFFSQSMTYLRQCNDVCKDAGVIMNVVMLPYRSQLLDKDRVNRNPQNMVKAFCFNQHIPFADPIDFCSNAQNPKDLYLFADEIHFSEAGHKMIADYILTL